jgi:hypothetical protein
MIGVADIIAIVLAILFISIFVSISVKFTFEKPPLTESFRNENNIRYYK